MDMHFGRLHVWVLGALIASLAAGVANAQAVRVAGTRVSLVPPDGFSPAQQFPGFQHAGLEASIMVSEMPGSAFEMQRGMTREALARQGMTLIGARVVSIDGREAALLHLGQKVGARQYLKWMLVAGDHNTTTLIVGTFPANAGKSVSAAIETSVLTASWGVGGSVDPFDGLLFRVSPTEKLKLARRVSNMLMLTESGTTGSVGPDEALYVVGNSVGDAGISNLQAFAEARARQTAQLKDIRNVAGGVTKVDGLEAYELVADARDASTGTAMKLYQVIMPDVGGYFIVQGQISARRAGELLPEFRRVTATFRRVR